MATSPPRARTDGDDSLVLHLARVGGPAAATAAAFFDRNVVGLYSFTTRESMRGRGIGSALIRASHAVAPARGIEKHSCRPPRRPDPSTPERVTSRNASCEWSHFPERSALVPGRTLRRSRLRRT